MSTCCSDSRNNYNTSQHFTDLQSEPCVIVVGLFRSLPTLSNVQLSVYRTTAYAASSVLEQPRRIINWQNPKTHII